MPRYIDAENFSERFDMMCDAGGVLAPVTEAVREMVNMLIKAEELQHTLSLSGMGGEKKTGDYVSASDFSRHYYFKCSCCKDITIDNGDYCPSCGAKMDGGVSCGANH